MAWWPGGNARQPLGPQAREAQRPDRGVLGTSRAGVGPAPSQGIFIGRLVIISGTGVTSGIFVYNGRPAGPVPGPANPPQIAIVPTGVTVDPYGNAITSSKILMQGNVITEAGGIFRTAALAPLIQLDGPHNAVEIYNAASQLIVGLAGAATNDGFGSAIPAGVSSFVIVTGIFAGTYAVTLNDQLQPWGTNVAALTFHNFTNAETLGPAVTAQAHATAGCNLNMQSGKSTAGAVGATVQVQDSVSSGVAGGLVDVLARFLEVLSTDGTTYVCGHFTGFQTTDQTITSTTFATVCQGTSVEIGKYRVRAVLQCQQVTAAVADNFRLGFTGTISQVRMGAKFFNATAAALPTVVQTTSNNGVLGSPAYAVNTLYTVDFDGIIVTTSTGTLSIQAQESAAGDTFTVLALSFFHLEPVG